MKSSYRPFYKPDVEAVATVWREGVFAFDSSVLLNLYRYPQAVRNDLFQAISAVRERAVLPHQVGHEYHSNRGSVIAEQLHRFSEVRELMDKAIVELEKGLDGLQLKKRHSVIDPDSIASQFRRTSDALQEKLTEAERTQFGVNDDDPIRNALDDLFDGRVTSALSKEDLDRLLGEAPSRCERHQPPGFADQGKDDAYIVNNLVIPRCYGDLVLWEQLCRHASNDAIKHVVFVTDDEKEDWWQIVRTSGDQKIGPRPELVCEIFDRSGIETFLMYTSRRFLEHARTYADVNVADSTLDVLEDISAVQSTNIYDSLAGAQLRSRALDLVSQVRERLAAYHQESNSAHRLPWDQMREASDQASTTLMADFDARWKIDAILLRDAILRRTGEPVGDRQFHYEHPTNPIGIGHIADDLEKIAKCIP